MSENWKPGDVAMVSDEHGTERVAVYGAHNNPRLKHGWHYDERGIGRILVSIRRLVVIDPEDREQVERLTDLLWDTNNEHTASNDMQAALREFANPTPPLPDEPPAWSVVVVASNTPFTRVAEAHITTPYYACWFGEHPQTGQPVRLSWNELHALGDVEIVGMGVTP